MGLPRRDDEPTASILHADLDSFYASVEQRDNPDLRDRPVAVGGGVILAASYEAKTFGVGAPMPEFQARRRCPDLVVVPPRFAAYTEASKAVFEIFRETTPYVEGLSVDEAFLDVSGLGRSVGDPMTIAATLRRRVRDEVGLAISVGVARTKFLAKVASASAKPDGLLRVDPDGEDEFLHPLPVGRLWGVGAVTEAKLNARGLYTVADVAAAGASNLIAILGPAWGRHIDALAHHRDPRRVETGRRRGSIGSQQALGRGERGTAEIESLVLATVDRVTRRMRSADRLGRTVTVRLRFDDFSRATRSKSLRHPTASTDVIAGVAIGVVRAALPVIRERGLTMIGLSVGGLTEATSACEQLQFSLFQRSQTDLDGAVDALRQRFGASAVSRASLARTRTTPHDVPMLPD